MRKDMFKKILKKVESTHSKYVSSKGELESLLFDYVDFDFSIDDMPGDGFILLDYINSRVAPVESCFDIIIKKGKLTQIDMTTISI